VFVTLLSERTDSRSSVTIKIRDTGPGIAAANLQKVFIPFFTTKASGHGVGLPLAHRIISEHGGSLTAVNAAAGGAEFTIRLPAK
jgi:signal transduction histidine kinase